MKFPQDFIERVRDASNIVDIIGQYVQLRRTGGNHQGLCPFHGEKSPSFSVSEDKQVYYCFGCKASGNVFTFVQNYQGLTFPETIEFLASRAGIPIPVMESDAQSQSRDIRQTLAKVNALAADFYHQKMMSLSPDHEVRKYLRMRGMDQQLVETYKLGYAPDDWTELADFLHAKKVPVQYAEQVGLLKRRGADKDGHYDLFRHRLMFPIFSPTGSCLGFGGRVLSKDQQPKYLNSPDSPVFHKGKVFYGLNHSAKFIRSEDEAIVVEGYMDWLALAKAGIGNAVATLGTALTQDHAKMIQRYSQKVLLLFDGDEAGKSAARRSLPILLSEGVMTRGLFLPDNLDPDEFLKERGTVELRKLIAEAPDLFDLIVVEQLKASKGSPSAKIQLLDEFAEILAQVADPRLKQLYGRNLASMLDVDLKLVAQSVQKALNAQNSNRPAEVPKTVSEPEQIRASEPVKIDLSKAPKAELELLNVMLTQEVYLKEGLGIAAELSHPGMRVLFQRLQEVYGLMPNKFDTLSALLAGEVTPVETVTRHLSEPYVSLKPEAASKLLQDCIKRIRQNFLRSKSKALASTLRGIGESNQSDQLEQIMNIHKSRRDLNSDS